MSDRKSKKKQVQVAAIVGLVAAAFVFLAPVFNGKTLYRTWFPQTAKTAKKTTAGGGYKPLPAGGSGWRSSSGTGTGAGTGAPARGTERGPQHDITAREQADLDKLIQRKLQNR